MPDVRGMSHRTVANEWCLCCVVEEDSSGWRRGPRAAHRSVPAACRSSPAEGSAQQPLGQEDGAEPRAAEVTYCTLSHTHDQRVIKTFCLQ